MEATCSSEMSVDFSGLHIVIVQKIEFIITIIMVDSPLTDGGEVVRLTHRPPFTPSGRFLALISVRG
jgi:hypothetical protein